MPAATKWQDWASFALGLWLAVSPWAAGYVDNDSATGNAVIVGLVLAMCSHFECVACDELPAEWFNLAVGFWLIAAPFVLDFDTAVATANTIAVGAFVALLAASALSLEKYLGKFWHKAQH